MAGPNVSSQISRLFRGVIEGEHRAELRHGVGWVGWDGWMDGWMQRLITITTVDSSLTSY